MSRQEKIELVDNIRNHRKMGLITKNEYRRRFREIMLGRKFKR